MDYLLFDSPNNMSFEKSDDNAELKEMEFIRSHLAKNPLDWDTTNDWIGVAFGSNPRLPDSVFLNLQPLLHYHEYQLTRQMSPARIDLIMQLSDPRAVKAYDQLVDEFNRDLEQIIKTCDRKKCKEYLTRSRILFEKFKD